MVFLPERRLSSIGGGPRKGLKRDAYYQWGSLGSQGILSLSLFLCMYVCVCMCVCVCLYINDTKQESRLTSLCEHRSRKLCFRAQDGSQAGVQPREGGALVFLSVWGGDASVTNSEGLRIGCFSLWRCSGQARVVNTGHLFCSSRLSSSRN